MTQKPLDQAEELGGGKEEGDLARLDSSTDLPDFTQKPRMTRRNEIFCLVLAILCLGTLAVPQLPGVQLQCGKSNPSGVRKRVVSGTTAIRGAWPWQALLLFGYRKTFVCSGALIHPSWVLTAAHCIKFRSPGLYTVRLGEFDRSRNEGYEQSFEVEKTIVHPHHDFPTPRNNDLALIKLRKPAVINNFVSPVCLPTAKDYLHSQLSCYATGWGLTGESRSYSRTLQQAHVPLVTKYKCRRRANGWRSYWFSDETEITSQMLCGGDDFTGASTCLGDSGGPYVCRNTKGYWVLQGITSWGSKKCLISERYSVFAKVGVFTTWIEKVMNGTDETEHPPTMAIAKKKQSWTEIMRWFFTRMLRHRSFW